MKRTLLCLAIGFAPLLAHAGCEDNFRKWTSQLHPGRALDEDHAVCKIWPANEALTIAALPLPHEGNADDEGTDDLEVLVADSATGTIVAHAFERAAIQYDAVGFSGLDIDTARYQLTPDSRAFGVRVMRDHNSRAAPYSNASVSLYVIDGPRLRKVLDRLVTSELQGDYGSDGSGSTREIQRTLEIGPTGKDGYASLKVRETSIYTKLDHDAVEHAGAPQRATFTLEYRNGKYGVPKSMQYSD
jgi:hypothetical protein